MLDKFLALLERFVVAHELIAANSAKTTLIEKVGDVVYAEEKVSGGVGPDGAFTVDNKTGKRIKIEVEDDLSDDEPTEAPKTRKPRTTKPKEDAPKVDLEKLRDEITTMAQHIGSGDSDECDDEFQDLMADYDVRTVKKLKDEDVEKFHKELKAIVAKYYEMSDD